MHTHHTVCKRAPLFKMIAKALICRLKTEATNKQFAQLFRLFGGLQEKEQGKTETGRLPVYAI